MHTIRPAALLALVIAVPAVAGAATTALQCGNIYDSKSARLVGARTIVVTDGRIAQVLRERANVAGAETIDLAGHTCTPGWTDLHVHLSAAIQPAELLGAASASTTPISRSARSATPRRRCSPASPACATWAAKSRPHLRNAINQGLVKGPRIYAAGKLIATTGGHADPTNGLNSEIAEALRSAGPDRGRDQWRRRGAPGGAPALQGRLRPDQDHRHRRRAVATPRAATRRSSPSTRSGPSSIPRTTTATRSPRTRTARRACAARSWAASPRSSTAPTWTRRSLR